MKKIFSDEISTYLSKEIREVFYLQYIKTTKVENATWMELGLKDRKGTCLGRIWADYIKPEYQDMEHSLVEVLGKVEVYRDRFEIRIILMRPVSEGNPADFQDTLSNEERRKCEDQILAAMDAIKDDRYRALCQAILKPGVLAKCRRLPGYIPYSYSYAGGYLKSISDLLKFSDTVIAMAIPEREQRQFQEDLFVAAVLLSNIGHINHYSADSFSYWKNSRSDLLGTATDTIMNLVLTNRELPNQSQVPDITPLLHIVNAVHGVVEPQTKEAIALCKLQELVCSMSAYDECLFANQKKGNERGRLYSKYFGMTIEN